MNPTANMPIRTIAALTGVRAVTLRAWERRYGLVRPARTPKGHRLYSAQHVERIRRVLALVERGVPIGRVRELIDSEPVPESASAGDRWRDAIEQMSAAIARFDELELDRIYDEAAAVSTLDPATYFLDGTAAPPRLVRHGALAWPRPGRIANGIEVAFTAGYGPAAADVPAPVRQAILLLVAHWYEHRSPLEQGARPEPVPTMVSELLAAYRTPRL